MRRGRWLVLGATLLTSFAHADDTQQCVASSEKAQQLRNAGKLHDARAELLTCSRPECPKVIQQDCTVWMRELLSAWPSVVPGAKDRRGRDVLDVRVAIDDKPVTDRLDGRPIPVDPGVHAFRFESSLGPPVTERVLVRQGEQNRILTVTLGDPLPKAEPAKSRPALAYVLSGIGLAAIGTAIVVGLQASGEARDLRGSCAPMCAQGDVDAIQSRYVAAGIVGGVGGAALLGGALWFFFGGRRTPTETARLDGFRF